MLKLVDSHCHLNYPEFAADMDGFMARARDADVTQMLTICTTMGEFPNLLAFTEKHPNLHCTVGVHPHEAEHHTTLSAEDLVKASAHPKVVGFGETGLDYFYEHSPKELQKNAFRAHLSAAQETGLPLVIHTREAEDDTYEMLKEAYSEKPITGVIHCFTSSRSFAEKALDLGFYISISGIVTFKKATDLQAIVKDLPLDRLLVETDAPYLAPMPHRGKVNEPSFVRHTAQFIADLKGISLDVLAEHTTSNYLTLFKKAAS